MAITNPFSITYGSRQVGGSTGYLLHGPYVIDKDFQTLRLVFDVVITAASFAALQSSAESLEDDFRKRDQSLTISLDGSDWTYTFGSTLLNSTASISKSGDRDTDKGFSRAYTCVVEAELPADDNNGLRDVSMNVAYEAGRQKIVTFQGVYTAGTWGDAVAQYQSDFDGEASTALSGVDGSATWELVDEEYTKDRTGHGCQFTRQYVELLFNQSQGGLDHANIRDHRVVFTDLSAHPGDSLKDIYRLRRMAATYDCAVDIEQTTDLKAVYEQQVRDHLLQTFRTNFNPKIFGIEDTRLSYDETSKRISVALQFIYQKDGGEDVVEVSQSLAYRENRTIDYTPVHDDDEHAAYADPGWAVYERVHNRTVIVLGEESPRRRIGAKADDGGPAGKFDGIEADEDVQQEGWNIVGNVSQVTDQYVGDPDEEQIRLTVLTETVTERWNSKPGSRTPLTFGGASSGA